MSMATEESGTRRIGRPPKMFTSYITKATPNNLLRHSMLLKSIGAWFATALLSISGAIGIFIGLSDIFGLEHHFAEKKPIAILISMVGFLALSLGFERAVHQRKLDNHLDEIEKLVATQVGGRMLLGVPEIYSTAIGPVSCATRAIRTVIYGKSAKAPLYFPKAVARRLQESKRAGRPVSFIVIFAIDLASPPPDFFNGVEDRFNSHYAKLGVGEQVQLRVMNSPEEIGFDTLLIDDDYAFVSFPSIHEAVDVQNSIYFERQRSVARELVNWFDQRLKPKSMDYWDWASKQRVGGG
jgi:hypothetical protein